MVDIHTLDRDSGAFFNGTFVETFNFRTKSDGSIITGTITNAISGDLTMMFSDGETLLDCTTAPCTIELTPAGDDELPVTNYIYIPLSTKVLTVATDAWPTTFEHIRVSQVVVQTATTTETEGTFRNQNWNDHLADTNLQGHLSHIGAKLRQFEAQWDSGAEGSVDDTAGVIAFKATQGSIFQMHPQNFPQQDMIQHIIDAVNQGNKTFTISGDGDLTNTFPVGKLISVHGTNGNIGLYTITAIDWTDPNFTITVGEDIPSPNTGDTIGDDVHVVNSDSGDYIERTDLAIEVNDASGGSLSNSSFSVVLWGTSNKTGEPAHLMCNMPTGTYGRLSPEDAVADASAFSVFTIPKIFAGVGFLIGRATFQVTALGVWSLFLFEDLRGHVPNTAAGGGGGSGGVSTFLGLTDTPGTYTSSTNRLLEENDGGSALQFSNTAIADLLPLDGTRAMTGALDMGGFGISNSPTLSDHPHPDMNTTASPEFVQVNILGGHLVGSTVDDALKVEGDKGVLLRDGDSGFQIKMQGIAFQPLGPPIFTIGSSTQPWATTFTNKVDFGTNTITDGNMTGDWDMNGGTITNAVNITSGNDPGHTHTVSLSTNDIIMSNGLIANIRTGFVLCDGANGTPDMRDRFVRGAGAGDEAGATGGSETHVHSVTGDTAITAIAHVHAVTSIVNTGGSIGILAEVQAGTGAFVPCAIHIHCVNSHNTDSTNPSHLHSISFNSASCSTLPTYFELIFIMKT